MVAPPGEWCFFIFVIGLLSNVPPLARWRYCAPIQVSPLLIWWLSEADRWKTVHPSAKVTQERYICGMSANGWKDCRRRRTFPVTRRLSTNMYPKKRVFREIRPLNGNLSGIWNHVSRDTTWTRVRGKFCGIDPRKVAEVVRGSRHKKKQRLCDPFFSRSVRNP